MNANPEQQQDGMYDGNELREPTLDQSLDAIDDVFMDRLPGEGESFLQHNFAVTPEHPSYRPQYYTAVQLSSTTT